MQKKITEAVKMIRVYRLLIQGAPKMREWTPEEVQEYQARMRQNIERRKAELQKLIHSL